MAVSGTFSAAGNSSLKTVARGDKLAYSVTVGEAVATVLLQRRVGTTANAVTANTPLTPAIVIGNRSANQVIATVDYIRVEQDR